MVHLVKDTASSANKHGEQEACPVPGLRWRVAAAWRDYLELAIELPT